MIIRASADNFHKHLRKMIGYAKAEEVECAEGRRVSRLHTLLMSRMSGEVWAGLPRPLFPFEAADVGAIYTHRHDAGDGLCFGLIDGRVFRRMVLTLRERQSLTVDARAGYDLSRLDRWCDSRG